MIHIESIFIPQSWGRLHVKRIAARCSESDPRSSASRQPGPPVLMLHGAIENSEIFYTESGKGLAPFFARNGFDVYAADLRGRGLGEPRISRQSRHGQFESITEEIPAFVELIRERHGRNTPQLWVAHSWGGVLLLCVLARLPEYRSLVAGVVFFGTKRSVYVRNVEKLLKIDLFWNRAARALVGLHGYLPALGYGIGSDNESDLSHAESRKWVMPGPWVDPRDGFDYGKVLPTIQLPPMLFLAGRLDACLGHPQDVQALIRELGPREVEFRLLGKGTGHLHDYGHIDMMTHPDAPKDHFLEVLRWARRQLALKNT